MTLLSKGSSNAKQAKLSAGLEVRILYLTPGPDVCPWSVANGCLRTCLAWQGRYKLFETVGQARDRKHRLFFEDRPGFMATLRRELGVLERKADRSLTLGVARLDGTSDLGLALRLHAEFPNLLFYDYTKSLLRVRKWSKLREQGLAKNYHLTFSLGAANEAEAAEALLLGANVAVAFAEVGKSEPLPATYTLAGRTLSVIDGDKHDWRWRDPWPCIVGLRAKGDSASLDEEGFFK